MLHLGVNKEFTYLNYISVMSAIRKNKVTIWITEEPSNEYWDIVRKVKSITFKNVDLVTGITVDVSEKIGRTDIIYIGKLTDSYIDDAMIDHKGLYEENGEFEAKDMCLVRVFKPEIVTLEYIRSDSTLLANLVQRVLIERVWNR